MLGERYYVTVDPRTAVEAGARIDPDTVLWWMHQSEPARKHTFGGLQLPIEIALRDFALWLHTRCAPRDIVRPWGNGASFDCTIVEESCRRSDIQVPWEFWNVRDYRTFKSLFPSIKREEHGVAHNALDDAVSQAQHMIAIVKHLMRVPA